MSKDQFVVCIVGGGSRYTPGILKMLVAEKDRFPLSKVILYDNEYDRQAKIGEYGRILMSEYYPECEVIDTTDPETAFTGIDFAFMQIRAGRMKMRRSDEHIALKHGCCLRHHQGHPQVLARGLGAQLLQPCGHRG